MSASDKAEARTMAIDLAAEEARSGARELQCLADLLSIDRLAGPALSYVQLDRFRRSLDHGRQHLERARKLHQELRSKKP